MKNKFKFVALAILAALSFSAIFTPNTIAAGVDCSDTNIPEAVRKANGCSVGTADGTLEDAIIGILQAVIGIAGLVAVVFVIIGGINYITSTGDPGKTKKAKDTILYALIGLIICALAFAIVTFVIGNILKQGTASDDGDSGAYVLTTENYIS